MQDGFVDRAFAAAKISPEAFAAEFKSTNADANAIARVVCVGFTYRDFLVHKLISDLPDEKLPEILAILHEHHGDFKKRNCNRKTALSLAIVLQKKETIKFLLDKKVEIDKTVFDSLVYLMITTGFNGTAFDILKMLIDHGVNVNFQDDQELTFLMCAVINGDLKAVEYLISKDTNLFLKYTGDKPLQRMYHSERHFPKTILNIAFEVKNHFISGSEYNNFLSQNNIRNSRSCFLLLMKEVENYLYHQGASFSGNVTQLKAFLSKYIDDLAGYDNYLKKSLEKSLESVVSRIQFERAQLQMYQMASKVEKLQQNKIQDIPPIYRFFQKDLVAKIFSYLHESPYYEGMKKPKA